ncbi:MAG: aldo/keto reductase [Alphaproteobacteria bacterium]|nr:aldo/keto reductase [Alphaproteobacteria bacterium]
MVKPLAPWHPAQPPRDVTDLYASSTDRNGAISLFRRAVDLGVTFFDTAEAYGLFMSEDVLGEALQGIRDRVIVSTKFGFDIDLATGQRRGGVTSRPDHIRRVVKDGSRLPSVGSQSVSPASSPRLTRRRHQSCSILLGNSRRSRGLWSPLDNRANRSYITPIG